MKIALYYPWIYLTSGAERVLLELTGRSVHHWTLFTNRFEPENTFPEFRNRRVVELGRVSVRRSVASVLGAAVNIFWQRLPLEGYDALVVVCEGLGDLTVLRNRSIPAINVCLTPLRIAFDDYYRKSWSQAHGLLARAIVAAGTRIFRAVDRLAWRRYAKVFCISRECLARVERGKLGRPSLRELLYPGIGIEPQSDVSRWDPFFLVPGRIMWTKNIELAIEAFRIFRRRSPANERFRLVIAGIVDRKSQIYLDRLKALAAGIDGVEFRIHPSDAELAELYSSCYGMLFTAFNEDWGIVPIEAMAFGKPVLSVNRGGPRESVQHGIQGFLEEPEPARFAERMNQLVSDPELAKRMGAAGPDRARLYSWDEFAARIDQAIEHAVASRGVPSPAMSAAREPALPPEVE
jgi:glycosyltransferase involved in cell wall biosynthesis